MVEPLPRSESLYGDFALTYEIVGDSPVPESQRPTTNYQVVSPTYFSTLDLPIVAGRAFDTRDTRDSPRVCIVNEAVVRTLGGRSPIGHPGRVHRRRLAAEQAERRSRLSEASYGTSDRSVRLKGTPVSLRSRADGAAAPAARNRSISATTSGRSQWRCIG